MSEYSNNCFSGKQYWNHDHCTPQQKSQLSSRGKCPQETSLTAFSRINHHEIKKGREKNKKEKEKVKAKAKAKKREK
jgi:hypothetical protein